MLSNKDELKLGDHFFFKLPLAPNGGLHWYRALLLVSPLAPDSLDVTRLHPKGCPNLKVHVKHVKEPEL